ncbi:dihydrofolate reductase family protein [Actinoplanes sp. G11-F43]|uniref:dihydrofolate reductase family protein n=1 Tax=Actinoplanes sp. G11-F43 TaxID=3424130 RepID=UPI003D34AD2F
MAFVTVSVAVSVDGFMAGHNQRLDKAFGDGPTDEIMRWMMETREENAAEIAEIVDADAFIMGRNMFSPGRGEWDPEWTGWWGEDPPYHKPVFVLTSHAREDLPMAGGTTFHFVTGGPHEALERAVKATGDGRISIAGGATTINQFLTAGLVDQIVLHVAPVIMGAGTRLFDGVPAMRLQLLGSRSASLATHITYKVVR